MMVKFKVESLKFRGLCLAAILFSCLHIFAQSAFDEANAAYAEGRYGEAAAMYQSLLDEQPDAQVYYNLGNTYFKQGELAQSILAYERALRLNPNDKDAKYNLAFAQSRALVVIQPPIAGDIFPISGTTLA